MKKFIGLFVLVIALAVISGCTQPAQPTVTTPVTTEETTVPPTVIASPAPTMEPTTLITSQSATTIATTAATTMEKTPTPTLTPSTRVTKVHIRNNSFVPNELVILPGTGITWINDDATVHAIKTTGSHQGKFNSGDFTTQWQYTFGEDEGTFDIIDTYSNSTSVIIVKKGESVLGAPTARPATTP
jgi:plastocyanin